MFVDKLIWNPLPIMDTLVHFINRIIITIIKRCHGVISDTRPELRTFTIPMLYYPSCYLCENKCYFIVSHETTSTLTPLTLSSERETLHINITLIYKSS